MDVFLGLLFLGSCCAALFFPFMLWAIDTRLYWIKLATQQANRDATAIREMMTAQTKALCEIEQHFRKSGAQDQANAEALRSLAWHMRAVAIQSGAVKPQANALPQA